jgi:poly(A) polymerase
MLFYKGSIYVEASGAEQAVEKLLLSVLPASPFAGKAYAVGGYVRDEVMGLQSKDLDIVVEAPDGAQQLAKYLHDKFPKQTSQPYQIGKGYPIWHIAFKADVTDGGHTYHTKGAELDLADSQKESFPDPKTRQRVTEYGTLNEDAERRDFTANMLMKDLTTGEIVDPTGTGVDDIHAGVLRLHPNVNPDKPFSDDPLRMLRLIRFMVKYGWKPDKEAVEAVKRNVRRIDIVSGERIKDELSKIMLLGKLDQAIRFMSDTGLLGHVMPEIEALKGVRQSPEHHAEGDVFEHTMRVLQHAKPTVEAQLAALLHDTGKPATQTFLENKIQFLGHEKVSEQIAYAFLRRLRFDNATIDRVVAAVRNHMRPHTAHDWGVKAVRKFIRDLGDHAEAVLDLAEADSMGSLTPDGAPAKGGAFALRERIKQVQNEVPVSSKPALSGKDVMQILGIPSGPEVGEVMRWLQERADDLAEQGAQMTPEVAADLLRREYKRNAMVIAYHGVLYREI